MTYGDFKKEFNSKRPIGVTFAFMLIPIMLNDNPELNFSEIKGIRNLMKFLKETFVKPMDESQPDNIKEMNRRLLDLIEESYALGLFEQKM